MFIRSRSYTCTTVSYKKELHRSWWISLFFPRKDLETFFLSASLYFSVCLSVCNWNLGQNFQSLQDKTLHIIIKFEGQCQISKSGQGHNLRSEVKIVLYNFVFFFRNILYHIWNDHLNEDYIVVYVLMLKCLVTPNRWYLKSLLHSKCFKFTIFTYLYIKRFNSIYQSARLIKYDILEHLM